MPTAKRHPRLPTLRRWRAAALWAGAAWVAVPASGAALAVLWGIGAAVTDVGHAGARLGSGMVLAFFSFAYLAVHAALVGAVVWPALALWATLGRSLWWVEGTRAGVLLAAGGVAALAALLPLPTWEVVAEEPTTRVMAWAVTWASIAMPRLLCRALRPGTFAEPAR